LIVHLKLYPSLVADLFDCYTSNMLNECWIATLSWSKIALGAHFEHDVCIVDTTTSADGTYEISQKSAENVSEDQGKVTKRLSDAPNQSSEDLNLTDSSPTSKGKPQT
jgi:nitric oxide reductase activation protein